MAYVLDHNTPHAEALIGLINSDNAATIVTPFTTESVTLGEPVANAAKWDVEVTRATDPSDSVTVTYTRLKLEDKVTLLPTDFEWYDEAQWGALDAVAAKDAWEAAAVRAGLNPTVAFDSVTIRFEEVATVKKMFVDVDSYIWEPTAEYDLPVPAEPEPLMSEEVPNGEPNGFNDPAV